MKIKSVGIIGFGSFGRLLANSLTAVFSQVLVFDKNQALGLPDKVKHASLDEVAKSDLIFLAVPFGGYDVALNQLKPLLSQESILVDICSVKLKPVEKIKTLIPEVKLVAAHPLFGPESDRDGLRNVVICPESSDSQATDKFIELVHALGWKIIEMSADEHDRQMAQVQALTFFIAQGLINMKLVKPELPTSFYSSLQRLIDIQSKHSKELTDTIEKYNPYAAKARANLLNSLNSLDSSYSR